MYEVLATTADCKDDRCPTLLRDPVTGRIGVQGYVTTATGETIEHISWMSPADWNSIRTTGA